MRRTGIYRPTIEDVAELSGVDTLPPGGWALTHRMGLTTGMRAGLVTLVVASARGNQALYYREHFGVSIVGVDIDADVVAEATRRASAAGHGSLARFVVGDAQDLPFPDAHFDIVVNEGAVGIPQDPERVLREMVRVTKPLGMICFRESTWRMALGQDEKRELTERYGTSLRDHSEWLELMREVGIRQVTSEFDEWSRPDVFWRVRKDREVQHHSEIFDFKEKLFMGKRLKRMFGSEALRVLQENETVFYAAVEAGKIGYALYAGIKPADLA